MDAAGEDGVLELISFEISDQEFCIDVRNVREIRGWTPTTAIAQAPAYIPGVINLRGAVVPVVDLRARLGLGRTEPSSRNVIVVIHDADRVAGLLVDGVRETFRIDAGRMQPPPMEQEGAEAFVDAILPIEGRMLSRLVVAALLPRRVSQAA